LSRRLRQDL